MSSTGVMLALLLKYESCIDIWKLFYLNCMNTCVQIHTDIYKVGRRFCRVESHHVSNVQTSNILTLRKITRYFGESFELL